MLTSALFLSTLTNPSDIHWINWLQTLLSSSLTSPPVAHFTGNNGGVFANKTRQRRQTTLRRRVVKAGPFLFALIFCSFSFGFSIREHKREKKTGKCRWESTRSNNRRYVYTFAFDVSGFSLAPLNVNTTDDGEMCLLGAWVGEWWEGRGGVYARSGGDPEQELIPSLGWGLRCLLPAPSSWSPLPSSSVYHCWLNKKFHYVNEVWNTLVNCGRHTRSRLHPPPPSHTPPPPPTCLGDSSDSFQFPWVTQANWQFTLGEIRRKMINIFIRRNTE